jgi:integrase
VLELYAEGHAPNAADPARIAYAIKALQPFWGDSMVGDITKSTCARYGRERAKAPATIRRELATLKAAINYSVSEGYLTRPVPVELPERPPGKERWLTHSEAARLLNAARTARSHVRPYLPLFILIGLYTGARKEAILSLRWSQVDLNARRINFAKPGTAQTSKGRARIPIPDRLYRFLVYAKRRGSDTGFVLHDNGHQIREIGTAWTGAVKKDGKPVQPGSFGTACKRAGLRDVSPHTLRHTCGTWMAQRGVDLWQIAGWLGQSLATTTELYAHHHPDYMEDAKKSADRRNK